MLSSSSPSEDKIHVIRAPAHIELPAVTSGLRSFPPPGASWPLTFSLSFDAKATSAFAKLRADFTPKASPRTCVPLFAFIPPERIASVSAEDAEIPDSVRPELQTGLTKLSFALDQPVSIVSPPTPLVPKNKASGDILEMLQCIAMTSSFTVYLPRRYLPVQRTVLLCRMARGGGLRSRTGDSKIGHLYNGKGGRAYEAGSFDPFKTDSTLVESPPSYDELALSPRSEDKTAPPYSGRPSKRRRTAPSSSEPDLESDPREFMETLCRQIAQDVKADLRKELREEMRAELQEKFSIELRREMDALEKHILDSIDKRLNERGEALRQEFEAELSDVREYVHESKEEALDEAGDLIDLRIDEQITGIKDELQTYVSEELKDVEDRIKDDISASNLSLTFA